MNFLNMPTRLIWPLALVIIAAFILLVAAIYLIVVRHADKVSPAFSVHPLADTHVTFSLETDLERETAERYVRDYKRTVRIALTGLIITILSFAIIAARPAVVDKQNADTRPRDIILCLDVSGSALAYDRQIIAAYSQLVKNMHGERIGLSIFNSTSKTVFPLTDDYSVVNNQLNYAYSLLNRVQNQDSIDAMSDKEYKEVNDWLEGTQNVENSTSLIGDGLVSCSMMLPQLNNPRAQKARSASIILATDNVPSGKQTFTLNEALDITKKASINVDALYIGTDKTSDSPAAQDMNSAITKHGGTYVDLNSNDTVDDIVNAIFTTKSGIKRKDDSSNLIDAPAWIAGIGIIGLFVFIAAAGRIKR